MHNPANSPALYVGLISGTSMDGIDAALVEFGDHRCNVLATLAAPYPHELRDKLISAAQSPADCTVDMIGHMDQWVGECFRDAAIALLEKQAVSSDLVNAIGSHGQTIRHRAQDRGAENLRLLLFRYPRQLCLHRRSAT